MRSPPAAQGLSRPPRLWRKADSGSEPGTWWCLVSQPLQPTPALTRPWATLCSVAVGLHGVLPVASDTLRGILKG